MRISVEREHFWEISEVGVYDTETGVRDAEMETREIFEEITLDPTALVSQFARYDRPVYTRLQPLAQAS
ncbi:MAG: hypothetical protein NT159_07155 [Proteobacteria bacterium]|nr:hypothetical protein [Pseudomonadota bacterium]